MNRAGIKPSLLDVINGKYSLPGQVPGQPRVQTIFLLMIEMDTLARRFGLELRRHFSPGSQPDPSYNNPFERPHSPFREFLKSKGLKSELQRFHDAELELAEQMEPYVATARLGMERKGAWPWPWYLTLQVQHESFRFVQELAELAKAGELERFRRCQSCNKWLFARVEHQRCCSLACRQKLHRSSLEFKEKRRRYMRQLRHEHRKRVFASTHPQRSPKTT